LCYTVLKVILYYTKTFYLYSSIEELLIGVVGVLVGLALLFFNRKASRSLVGSFFKQYYDSSMIAIVLLVCSFLVKLLVALGIDAAAGGLVHYILLILAGIVLGLRVSRYPKKRVRICRIVIIIILKIIKNKTMKSFTIKEAFSFAWRL
jgi:hypothetical protein